MHLFDLSLWQWICTIAAVSMIGFSKTGISGFMMPAIPLIASVFGGKVSTGIILPIMIVGDIFALYFYKRYAEWNDIKKLLPWTVLGVIFGAIVGSYIDDKQFKIFLSISVLLCLFTLIYMEKKGESFTVPKKTWFYILAGIISGLTSMIGNAAGPIVSVYLLAMGFKKNNYMGTAAWFFFILNLVKMPMQIFVWHNITINSFLFSMTLIPAIAVGALLGAIVIKKINEKPFRIMIIIVTALVALKLLI